jgi:hypothetical protein
MGNADGLRHILHYRYVFFSEDYQAAYKQIQLSDIQQDRSRKRTSNKVNKRCWRSNCCSLGWDGFIILFISFQRDPTKKNMLF